ATRTRCTQIALSCAEARLLGAITRCCTPYAFQRAESPSRHVVTAPCGTTSSRGGSQHSASVAGVPRAVRAGPALAVAADVVECWIGVTDDRDGRTVRVAGRFGAAEVPELLRACEGASTLTLDLTDLVSADAAGLQALHRMRRHGGRVVG